MTTPQLESSPWRSAYHPVGLIPRPLPARRRLSPEQELMLAVLRQGLDDYGRALTESHVRARRERYTLERWIFGDDRQWPYSYLNVCEAVGIDPCALRKELRRWRADRGSHMRLMAEGDRPFRLPNRAMRGSRTRVAGV
jgi:hypothetical protein